MINTFWADAIIWYICLEENHSNLNFFQQLTDVCKSLNAFLLTISIGKACLHLVGLKSEIETIIVYLLFVYAYAKPFQHVFCT